MDDDLYSLEAVEHLAEHLIGKVIKGVEEHGRVIAVKVYGETGENDLLPLLPHHHTILATLEDKSTFQLSYRAS